MPTALGAGGNNTRVAPSPVVTHGRQIGVYNTGLNYHRAYTDATLTPVTGFQNYSTNGQVVEGKHFDSRIDLTGNNILLRNCVLETGGVDSFGVNVTGSNVTIEGVRIRGLPGQSITEPIFVGNGVSGTTIRRCDISRGCQVASIYGTDIVIVENYFHESNKDSDATQHIDCLEVYGGARITVIRNWMQEDDLFDAVVNIAPWQAGNPIVDHCHIYDNWMSGGQEVILTDAQAGAGSDITNTQVLRNDMDQYTNPDTGTSFGINRALTDYESRPIYTTLPQQQANPSSFWWPQSAPDCSRWMNPSGRASPSWVGLIVVPPQSNGGP